MPSTYRRVLLKISGEALAGDHHQGEHEILDRQVLVSLANSIREVLARGVELAIVVGAGNIWRGKVAQKVGMERCNADYMGMLATIINALALQDVLEQAGIDTRVQTELSINEVAEPYIRRRAIRHLEKGRVLIFAGGTGSPFFSTDTAAALKAAEINADVILMAKNGVNGIYSADPKKDHTATMYSELSYHFILQERLAVMDATAVSLCMENGMEVVVFNMADPSNILRILDGEAIGTRIRKE